MRSVLAAVLALAAAAPAAAQTPPAELGARYVPAPWWMREPVIASIGYVRTEVPANRATFTATFQSVERTAAEATAKAAAQVRDLSARLAAYGPDVARVETTFSTRPLFDQYRDKDGNVLENQRADKIDRYQVDARVEVTVRDTARLARVYADVINARPTSTSPVQFRLHPSNEVNTELASEAVKDAARRARLSAEGAGARLGGVRVIDPTGRACQTDVLAGWPSYESEGLQPQEVTVTGARFARQEYAGPPVVTAAPAPPPPPAPGVADGLSLDPPLETLTARACVVYGLG